MVVFATSPVRSLFSLHPVPTLSPTPHTRAASSRSFLPFFFTTPFTNTPRLFFHPSFHSSHLLFLSPHDTFSVYKKSIFVTHFLFYQKLVGQERYVSQQLGYSSVFRDRPQDYFGLTRLSQQRGHPNYSGGAAVELSGGTPTTSSPARGPRKRTPTAEETIL